ncbi:unnamed protein product [Phyllotreta striolata]|uniref:Uncharacterized protein n=1 Tax=Phyllotreta striolata TaxID=444603 RepID=A0A9N9XQI1_PHYSR|nr:unnamed protein product [Phyllotreta striolata]
MDLRPLSLVFICVLIERSQGSALHGSCLTNDDCGTIDTYCRNQTCVCRENFSVWYDSCVQTPSPPLRCSKKHECHSKLGARSMCTKKGLCTCKPFHHLHQGQCVKNRDLHDNCEHDHQCYCGADCEDKIACIHKSCSCKPGHKPYRIRRCIHDPVIVEEANVTVVSTTTREHHFEQTTALYAEQKYIEQSIGKTVDKEGFVEPSVRLASTSSSNVLVSFGRYFIVLIVLATFKL